LVEDRNLILKMQSSLDFFARNTTVSLIIICAIGLFLRLFYFPFNVPLTLDALEYFFYATDTSLLGKLTPFIHANNGWPIFLSVFFTIFRFDNAIDYMTIQRTITISISVLTVIPVYFLIRRFFDKPYAIIGAAIFAFEPHLIQNSLLGITDPLYIFLIASTLSLVLSLNKFLSYSSFAIIALASLVRSEGLFVFFPLLIMFIIHHKNERKIIFKLLLVIVIFVLVLLPMVIFRIQTQGNDYLTGRISIEADSILKSSSGENHEYGLLSYTIHAVKNFIIYSGWSLIPFFIFLVPVGFLLILRHRNKENVAIIIVIISMLLPVFYAFSVASDTRYIYPLFPLFCILSVLIIKKAGEKTKNRKIFPFLIICVILLSSVIFLDLKKFDYAHQKEAFGIAQYVVGIASGVNDYYPEDSYLKPAEIPQKWPLLNSSISFRTSVIPTEGFDSLTQYIKFGKEHGLTHIVTDEHNNRPKFLNDVFYHEEKYPYLTKIYDSLDYGYKYHLKIFRIDYEKFKDTSQ
jgi:hypothetical protein